MSFFETLGEPVSKSNIAKAVEIVQGALAGQQIGNAAIARTVLSTESINEGDRHAARTAFKDLQVVTESIASELAVDGMTTAQKRAAAVAGMMAGDIQSAFKVTPRKNVVSTEDMHFINGGNQSDSYGDRAFSLEAYDERQNRDSAATSIVYNMQASRQDEFGETLFPTVVVSPADVGITVGIRLMMVYNEIQRNVSGALAQYNKKNIIRAIADATILKNESTKVVPVVRAQSVGAFVDAAVIPPSAYNLEGESIMTAPLAVGVKTDLMGLSQTDTLLAAGIMDMTDSLEPAMSLATLYVATAHDRLAIPVLNLPLSVYNYSVQNNYRIMTLNFDTTSALLNAATKNVDGSALTDLAVVATSNLIVRLSLSASGSNNIELGDNVVYGTNVSVHSVQDQTGRLLDLTVAPALDVVNAIAGAKIIGYDLKAYRTNANRRQRGQLIDTTYFKQIYNVFFRSPITAIRPVTTDGQNDASDLSALITATHIRTSNAAVTTLLETVGLLSSYIDSRDVTGEGPDMLGIGRFLVRPTFYKDTVDMGAQIDSLKSHERAEDARAVLVNKIRDLAYRMYRDSEYKAAADAMAGGISAIPTVIIATDPVLSRYLTVTGDLRTLGNEFDVRIVSTLDKRIAGQIFITFGDFAGNVNDGPNPLHFGCMAWKPELTVTLPISRNNQVSKELTVQPAFLHIVNLPILAQLTVLNVQAILGKVPVNFHQV